jgi:hypothetical protein
VAEIFDMSHDEIEETYISEKNLTLQDKLTPSPPRNKAPKVGTERIGDKRSNPVRETSFYNFKDNTTNKYVTMYNG